MILTEGLVLQEGKDLEKKVIIQYKKRFDDIRHEENGIEFWYARELMELLEYAQWRNFEKTIEKAKTSCENNGIIVADHFADAEIDFPN